MAGPGSCAEGGRPKRLARLPDRATAPSPAAAAATGLRPAQRPLAGPARGGSGKRGAKPPAPARRPPPTARSPPPPAAPRRYLRPPQKALRAATPRPSRRPDTRSAATSAITGERRAAFRPPAAGEARFRPAARCLTGDGVPPPSPSSRAAAGCAVPAAWAGAWQQRARHYNRIRRGRVVVTRCGFSDH